MSIYEEFDFLLLLLNNKDVVKKYGAWVSIKREANFSPYFSAACEPGSHTTD